MKALSIRQPWAHAIVSLGKDVENRTWRTTFRGPLLIHAAERFDDGGHAAVRRILEGLGQYPTQGIDPADLRRGGIIGQAELVDVVEHSSSPWFTGPFGFVLKNVRPLIFRECRGQLGFFDVAGADVRLPEPGHPDLFAGMVP